MMQRSQRRTDVLLTLLTLTLTIMAPIENALSNNLPQVLPTWFTNKALPLFAVLLAVMLIADMALIGIRRSLASGPILARSRAFRGLNIILTLALALMSAVAGVLGPLAVSHWSGFTTLNVLYHPWVAFVLPLALLIGLVTLPLIGDLLTLRSKQEVQDRQAFLTLLAERYSDYLDDPLQQAVRAHLDVRETPDALQRPQITLEMLTAGQPERSVPEASHLLSLDSNMTLLSVLEDAHERLLILGDFGAGKSTQLYRLGRKLVTMAQANTGLRLPVVFDLSTWASNKDTLEQWLADEIAESYRVRGDIAVRWVKEQQIFPLLDALDVMGEDNRVLCAREIDRYLGQYPESPVIVCCRRAEYYTMREQGTALTGLQMAVTFQPLSDTAIDRVLAQGGERLAGVREVIASDDKLRDVARTPLLLSMIILTYSDLQSSEIPLPKLGATEAWRHNLLGQYVDRMLKHKPGTVDQPLHFTKYQMQTTLSWLGYELYKYKINTFYLEQLQAHWLPDHKAQMRYRTLLQIIHIGLGLGVALVAGVGIGIGIGVASWLVTNPWSGLLVGVGTGLVGVVGGLVVLDYIDTSETIKPVARLEWPWKKIVHSIRMGLIVGSGVGLVLGMGVTQRFGLGGGLLIGLIVAVGTGVIVGVGMGPERVHVRDVDLVQPNEGIYQSLQSSLIVILIYALDMGIGGGLGLGTLGELRFGPQASLIYGSMGLALGLIVGAVVGLAFSLGDGSIAVMNYLALRHSLVQSRVVPSDLVRFLKEASSRALLRPVGGGFQFIHEVLRDDFAARYSGPKTN